MTGTILWFDQRDGYGIATDERGSEYYIDSSVIDRPELCRDGVQVNFEQNPAITHVRCGHKVTVNLASAWDRQLVTVKALESHGPEGLREGAIEEARAELDAIEELIEAEECEHAETECGHCLDCGEYTNALATRYNFSD